MRGREATERARLEREVEQMKRDMAVLAEQLEAQEPAQRGEDDPLQRRVRSWRSSWRTPTPSSTSW